MQHALISLLIVAAQGHGLEPVEEHPLTPVLRLAYDRYQQTGTQIKDYSCILVKRERIDGRLLQREHALVKVRHAQVADGRVSVPFSVYLRFFGPAEMKGREAIYVEGQNHGKLIARRGGTRLAYFTTALDPRSDLAMRRNRYPITEIGVRNLIKRLYEVGREDIRYGECDVNYLKGVTVNQRVCTAIEVIHPVRRSNFRFHIARIFIDDKFQVPIRYASYDWPDRRGGPPPLLEEYTYLDLKLNVGLTDRDFDTRNEAYGFGKDARIERFASDTSRESGLALRRPPRLSGVTVGPPRGSLP